MTDAAGVLTWLRSSDEPWTRYRTLVDLAGLPTDNPGVAAARHAMVTSPGVIELVARAATWPGYPLKRHNDAAHALYAIATLADFGLDGSDAGIPEVAEQVLSHFDGTGLESLLWLPRFLTKREDAEAWSWMMCDAPTLLYAMLAFGYGTHEPVRRAAAALAERADDNGWRCGAADSLPSFSGPGRKNDTCPMATTYALKALSLVPAAPRSESVTAGVMALLDHWEHRADYKLKMFGIGTEFRKLKYPYVWYDILHVCDVLSRFPAARADARFHEMVATVTDQADERGRYTAGSMYRAWSEWSFADKRTPSPWLTFLVMRICARLDA